MTREKIINHIKSLNEPFTTSELLQSLGGKNLTIDDKKEVLYILYDLAEVGALTLRNICDKYYYVKSASFDEKEAKLKLNL